MPQLPRDLVKARAVRLRDAGERALVRHLERQIGRTVEVLVEHGGVARAPDHTPVAYAGEPGALARLTPTGHDGRRLTL
jgi:threonylcarbamoyladenosine tRNA methylthiotransferase MtaB